MKIDYWDFNNDMMSNLTSNVLATSSKLRTFEKLFDETKIVSSTNHGDVEVYSGAVDIEPVYDLASIASYWLNWVSEIENFKSKVSTIGEQSPGIKYVIVPGTPAVGEPGDEDYIAEVPTTVEQDGYYDYELISGGSKSSLLDSNINVYGKFYRTFNSSDNYVLQYNNDSYTYWDGEPYISTDTIKVDYDFNIPANPYDVNAIDSVISSLTSQRLTIKSDLKLTLRTDYELSYDVVNATGLVDDWMDEVDSFNESKVTDMVMAPVKCQSSFQGFEIGFIHDNPEDDYTISTDLLNDILLNTTIDSEVELYEHLATVTFIDSFSGASKTCIYLRKDSGLSPSNRLYIYSKFATIYYRNYRPSRSSWVKFRDSVLTLGSIFLAVATGNPYVIAFTFASLMGVFDDLSPEVRAAISVGMVAYGYYDSAGTYVDISNATLGVTGAYVNYSNAKIAEKINEYISKVEQDIEAEKLAEQLREKNSINFIGKRENFMPLDLMDERNEQKYDKFKYRYDIIYRKENNG